MKRLSDNVLQAVLDAHKIFVSIDRDSSKVDKYTVYLLEELKMYRSSGLIPEDVRKIGSQVKKHD